MISLDRIFRGSLFHSIGPTFPKARSPSVTYVVLVTTRRQRDKDRNIMGSLRYVGPWTFTDLNTKRRILNSFSLADRQPVEILEKPSHMISFLTAKNDFCCGILHLLELLEMHVGNTGK